MIPEKDSPKTIFPPRENRLVRAIRQFLEGSVTEGAVPPKSNTETIDDRVITSPRGPRACTIGHKLEKVDNYLVLEKGVYYVSGLIHILPQGTLEIHPGARLLFGPQGGILSQGTFVAAGTENERIQFSTTEGGMRWGNITFAGENGKSVLECCDIEHGTGLMEKCYEILKQDLKGTCIKPHVGGGVLVFSCSPRFVNCKIAYNTANGVGGGMMLVDSSSTLSLCTFHMNVCNNGTYIFYKPVSERSLDGARYNTEGKAGGGIALLGSNATIDSCTFNSNLLENREGHYKTFGGGIFALKSRVGIFGSRITKNLANNGSGIYIDNTICRMQSNRIRYNGRSSKQYKISQSGGGIFVFASYPTMEGNVVEDNQAVRGAGVYLAEGSFIGENTNRIRYNRPDNVYIE